MDKEDYIDNLFDDIKNNIQFDTDVIALEKLLDAKLKINVSDSIEKWKYLIFRYDISAINKDIDLDPILNLFPYKIMSKIGIEQFFLLMEEYKPQKRKVIYKSLFNLYSVKSGIYMILKDIITNHEKDRERFFISSIIKHSKEYPVEIFDLNIFLKNVILLHLEINFIDIEYLLELTEIPNDTKEKAILKTMLIDYI